MIFHRGDRVILPADSEYGIVQERGEVIDEMDSRGMYLIEVDKPLGDDDDCIREVDGDDIIKEVPLHILR